MQPLGQSVPVHDGRYFPLKASCCDLRRRNACVYAGPNGVPLRPGTPRLPQYNFSLFGNQRHCWLAPHQKVWIWKSPPNAWSH